MKYVVRKAFWDYEKEEKWINEMSAKGMALTDYSWCRYVFTEAQNNEYTYRLELLKDSASHAESIVYLKFLEENGVECVATYWRWAFLRKKTAEGPFDIYTDIESKLQHLKRINILWTTFMWLEFFAAFVNVLAAAINLTVSARLWNLSIINIGSACFLTVLGILFLRLGSHIRVKIKKLQQEMVIRE